jgi:hypothetical protein
VSIKYCAESALACYSVNLIFIVKCLSVRVADLTYLSLVSLVALIEHHCGLISLCLYVFIENKWPVGVNFECFAIRGILLLYFGDDF